MKNSLKPLEFWRPSVILSMFLLAVHPSMETKADTKNVWIETPVNTQAAPKQMVVCAGNTVSFTANTSYAPGQNWSWEGANLQGSATNTPSSATKVFSFGSWTVQAIYNNDLDSYVVNVTAFQINRSGNLWWFNGATPSGYQTQVTLQADGPSTGTFRWEVIGGSAIVDLVKGSNVGDDITATNDQTIVVRSTGRSAHSNDVAILLSYNGIEGCLYYMSVYAPNSLTLLRYDDNSDATYHYLTLAHYKILDQFGNGLPAWVPVNEKWTTGVVYDYSGSQYWERGPESSATVDPNDFGDFIGGATSSSAIPLAQSPQSPLGTTKVCHWGQSWYVGSTEIGAGVHVQSKTLQYYRDHGRAE